MWKRICTNSYLRKLNRSNLMSPLKRQRHEMPGFIREALTRRAVMDAYLSRPDYQQNDYIGWIARARRESTGEKLLNQMLDELELGGSI